MVEDTELKSVPQPPRGEISRRPVVVGLIGLAIVEAVAGGITWKVLSQGLHKIALAFAPPVRTPTSIPQGAILYIYKGHSGGVNAVRWSHDGKSIVSGADDQTAQVWDATSGRHILTRRSQTGGVLTVAWSPDGKRIASGGGAQVPSSSPTPQPPTLNITLSGPCPPDSNGNPICTDTLTVTGSPGSISWSASAGSDLPGTTFNPQSGTLSTGQSQPVTVTIPGSDCPADGGGHYYYSSPGNISSVTFTCQSTSTPTAQSTPVPSQPFPTGLNFTVNQGHNPAPQIFTFINTSSTNINWSTFTDSNWLSISPVKGTLSPSQSQAINVAVSSANLHPATYYGKITFVTMAPNAVSVSYMTSVTLIVSPVLSPAEIWEATTGIEVLTYLVHKDFVNEVVWAPDGKYIASASSDATVQVWSTTSLRSVLTYTHHVASVNSLAWSPDGKYIASGSRDTTVQVWKPI